MGQEQFNLPVEVSVQFGLTPQPFPKQDQVQAVSSR